jgi:hypothetical protein
MGGAPIELTVYRNGVAVNFGFATWFTDPIIVATAHRLLAAGTLDDDFFYDREPAFKPIHDAIPSIDTFLVIDKHLEDHSPDAR